MTYRQLIYRYRGMMADRWDHTASLQATMLALVGGESVSPLKFNPYRTRPATRRRVTRREAKETSRDLHMLLAARKSRG